MLEPVSYQFGLLGGQEPDLGAGELELVLEVPESLVDVLGGPGEPGRVLGHYPGYAFRGEVVGQEVAHPGLEVLHVFLQDHRVIGYHVPQAVRWNAAVVQELDVQRKLFFQVYC